MKDMLPLILLLLLLLAVLHPARGDLDFSRLHIVDVHHPMHDQPVNLLVRSNMPVNESTFDIDGLVAGIEKRASALGGVRIGQPLYLRIVSLNNDFDKHFNLEKEFWRKPANAKHGSFTNWPLGLAGIEPPGSLPPAERRELLNSTVWAVDKLPTRTAALRQMLVDPAASEPPTPAGRSTVVVVHCTAGCDRTGEVIGAYRTTFGGLGADGSDMTDLGMKPTYALDTSECGRSPNYWSTTALEWWCFELLYNRGLGRGNCSDFAVCQPLQHGQPCEPTNRTAAAA
jgi:hypothetical protein